MKRTSKKRAVVQFAQFDAFELPHVKKIVDRAVALFREVRQPRERLEIHMDIQAVHARYPLDLKGLAEADDFNFAHDIGGIARHLDRKTGELRNFFSPRFCKREVPA